MFSSATSARRPASMTASSPRTTAAHQSREQEGLGVVGVVADGDAAVVEVGVEGVGGVAVAELAERFDLPFVLLASVVLQLDRRQPRGEGGEQAAGGDLGELLRVADEHGLGAGALRPRRGGGRGRGCRRCRLRRRRAPCGRRGRRVRRGRSRSAAGRSWSTGCRRPSTARRRRRRCARRRSPGSRRAPTRRGRRRRRTSCRRRPAR